jgi:hypothetical protein
MISTTLCNVHMLVAEKLIAKKNKVSIRSWMPQIRRTNNSANRSSDTTTIAIKMNLCWTK